MSNPNSIETALQRLVNGEDLLDVLDKPIDLDQQLVEYQDDRELKE